jgi:hypothetical protein
LKWWSSRHLHEHLLHLIPCGVEQLKDEMYKMNCHMEVLKEKIHIQNHDIIYEELLHANFNFYKQYFSTSYSAGNLLLMFFWSDSRFVLGLTGITQLKTAAHWQSESQCMDLTVCQQLQLLASV